MRSLAKMNHAAALLWITISASLMPAQSFADPARSVARYLRCFECADYAAACPICRPRPCIRANGGLAWCTCSAWDYLYDSPFWSSPSLF
jgi:hypothetical protein